MNRNGVVTFKTILARRMKAAFKTFCFRKRKPQKSKLDTFKHNLIPQTPWFCH
eukprot:UN03310